MASVVAPSRWKSKDDAIMFTTLANSPSDSRQIERYLGPDIVLTRNGGGGGGGGGGGWGRGEGGEG